MISITKKDIIWSYAAQIFNFGAGILILPIVLKKLQTDELAIWYAFMTLNSFVMFVEAGFSPTISRNISYVYSGAEKLIAKGINIIEHDKKKIDYTLLHHLIMASRKIYILLSCACLVIMFLFTFYIFNIGQTINTITLSVSWFTFLSASILSFYFGYFMPILIGQGKIKETKKSIVYSRLLFIIISYILIINGYGLIGISLAYLIYSISIRAFSYYYYSKKLNDSYFDKKNFNIKIEKEILGVLWHNSYKLGLVSFGAFLITKVNYLISTKYLGLEISASYGLTQQLLDFLVSSCTIFATTFIPILSQDQIQGNKHGIAEKYGVSLIIAWATYAAGIIVIIFYGNSVLMLINSNTYLLPLHSLLFCSLIYFLEFNHTIAATIITTKNDIPFLYPAIISGIIIVILSFLSIKFTSLGVNGLLLSQFIIQLLYNNWKWPYVLCKDIGYSFIQIIETGLKSIHEKISGLKK